MAQPIDDSFLFGAAPMTLAAARHMIAERIASVTETEHIELRAAGGRVTARHIATQAGTSDADGRVVLPAGTVLEARHTVLLASLGITTVEVKRRLKLALVSVGRAGRSNHNLLAALFDQAGAVITDLGALDGDPGDVDRVLAKAAAWHDLVVMSGKRVADDEAARIGSFGQWRVAIAPGASLVTGRIRATPRKDYAARAGALFCGIDGSADAVFVTFLCVIKPLLLQLGGALPQAILPLPVRATFAYTKEKGRRDYVRVSLRRGAHGDAEAVKHPRDAAGILAVLMEIDGLLEFTEDVTETSIGDRAGFLPFAALIG